MESEALVAEVESVDAIERADDVAARPRAQLLAWAVWLSTIVLTAVGLWLVWLDRSVPELPDAYGFRGFEAVFSVTYASVGAIVISRRPENVVGRILAFAGLNAAVMLVVGSYALYGRFVALDQAAGTTWAAWLGVWVWVPFITLGATLLFLVFPSGQLLSPRWRVVAYAAVVGGILAAVGSAITPGPLTTATFETNPLGVDAIAPLIGVASGIGHTLLVASFVGAAASLVVRYHRASYDTRRQLRWVAFAGAAAAVTAPFSDTRPGQAMFIVAVAAIPAAAGIAVLRYRLYDIDTVINRTLVYGLLTAVLAGLYAASVGLIQRIFQALTGETSDAAIVLTTLLVVTAFTPARNALQRLVDRRFKDPRDPQTRLAAFIKVLDGRLWSVDPDAAAEHLLKEVIDAYGAKAGRIEVASARRTVRHATGDPITDPALVVTVSAYADQQARIELGPRAGADYTPGDRESVKNALGALAAAVAARD